LISREGDFGFSAANGDPEAGHDIGLVNFSAPGKPLQLKQMRFAFNNTGDQAFTDPGVAGINRPTDLKFGPDGCAYLVDYGAVCAFSARAPPPHKLKGPAHRAARAVSGPGGYLEDWPEPISSRTRRRLGGQGTSAPLPADPRASPASGSSASAKMRRSPMLHR